MFYEHKHIELPLKASFHRIPKISDLLSDDLTQRIMYTTLDEKGSGILS